MRRYGELAVVLALLTGCGVERGSDRDLGEKALRVAIPAEPETWNRILATSTAGRVVTEQLHAPLIRLNQKTQEMEPGLAESWEFSGDGKELVFHLRRGVRFSDGEPFTAADVAFTFRALYDPAVASPLVETALVDGQPLELEILDDATVRFRLPRRTAAIERVFDSIGILPAHRLKRSLDEGTLGADTALSAPPENVVGLGPFALSEYLPGQRVVLRNNPFYWRAGPKGERFPQLDRLVFEILPDPSARLLRFRAGEIDLLEPIAPDAFEGLRREANDDLVLWDLGPGMVSERLWFNLDRESPIAEHKKHWFGDVRFRRAVSMGIDREALARVVFRGLASPASGPVSPANTFWRNDRIPVAVRDLEAARALLAESGFGWDAEGRLHGPGGRPVRFTVVTNAGNELRARTGAFLREDLRQLGMEVTTAPIDSSSLLARITGSSDYEACLLGITQTDPDPSAEMALWLSRGALHLWSPSQPSPATAWEARIDELMQRQMTALDPNERRAQYHEVQALVAEHLPVLDLVVPHALLGASRRVRHLDPVPFSHSLWNSDEISVASMREKTYVGLRRDVRH